MIKCCDGTACRTYLEFDEPGSRDVVLHIHGNNLIPGSDLLDQISIYLDPNGLVALITEAKSALKSIADGGVK
jgi:hypothetical protein